MLRVGSIVIRVDDLERQMAFWTAALDYERREERDDDFVLLCPRDGVGPNVSLDRVRSKVQIPPRIHLDLYAEDQAAEVGVWSPWAPPRSTGTSGPPDADYVILADPEGNRFCVVDVAADDRRPRHATWLLARPRRRGRDGVRLATSSVWGARATGRAAPE